MLVEIGSPYNVYSKPDRQLGAKGMDATEFQKTYGGFWRFDANKLNQTQADGARFSTGHRHALALAWHPVSKSFFMVQMGRDNLNVVDPEHYDALDNAERVSEVMHLLREGSNFGWPTTYWDPIKKAHMLAPEFGGDNIKRVDPDPYDKPVVAFPGHWAPIQMIVYTGTQFPEKYRNGAFVAFHGSWNRAPRAQAGYQIAFVPFDDKGMPTGTYETFADDFAGKREFVSTGDARFRPLGLAVGPDGSLYVSDTEKGRIWRVIYTGETRQRRRVRPRQQHKRRRSPTARAARSSISRSAPRVTCRTALAFRACRRRSSAAASSPAIPRRSFRSCCRGPRRCFRRIGRSTPSRCRPLPRRSATPTSPRRSRSSARRSGRGRRR